MSAKTKNAVRGPASRWVKITLERPASNPYQGTLEEKESIWEILRSCSGSYLWGVLSWETSDTNHPHYHAMIKFRSPLGQGVVNFLREYFETSPEHGNGEPHGNEIKLGRGLFANWIPYLCKDQCFTVDGPCPINCVDIGRRYAGQQQIKKHQEFESIIDPEVVKEGIIRQWTSDFMTKNHIQVNAKTRQLRGIQHDEFFIALHEAKFHYLFGSPGLKWVEEHIQERIYYDLPMWDVGTHPIVENEESVERVYM
jgi:hypothetical protein